MDSAAYLRRHGWQGIGHSLNPDNSRALKRPLLVSKKIDVLGVGVNKHDSISSQWWLKAFDNSLKAIGTGEKSVLSQIREHGVRRGGLYTRFVKGEEIPSTIKVRSEHPSIQPETQEIDITKTHSQQSSIQPETNEIEMPGKRKAVDSEVEPSNKRRKVENEGASGEGEKKLSYKAEKYIREKARRVAKREAKEKANIRPNETVEEGNKRRKAEKKAAKDERKEKAKAVVERKHARIAAREAKKEIKAAKREATKEMRARVAKIIEDQDLAAKQEKENGKEIEQDGGEKESGEVKMTDGSIEGNQDFVSLVDGVTTKKKKNYPSDAEKREKKLRAMAIEQGISVDELRAKQAREKEIQTRLEKEEITAKRAEKLNMSVDDYNSLPISNYDEIKHHLRKLEELDDATKERYKTRAGEKGQSLEKYYISRTLKNEKHNSSLLPTAPVEEMVGLGFTIDSRPSLPVPDVAEIKSLSPPDVLARVDPALWTATLGKKSSLVKTLPKEIRELRRLYMKARRDCKKSGGGGVVGGETRAQKKHARREDLAIQILKWNRTRLFTNDTTQAGDGKEYPKLAIGTNKGLFTPEEVQNGRKAARRMMKVEKIETKNQKKNSVKKGGRKR